MRNSVFFLLLTAILWSCRKDAPPEKPKPDIGLNPSSRVYVVNEGNFQFGNGSLSFYDPDNQSVSNEVFQSENNRALGDVFQSMTITNGTAYLVINNSAEIELMDPDEFLSEGTITGFNSPRHLLPVNNGKAYVSDLYADQLWVVGLDQRQITDSIPLRGWTGEMEMVYGDVFVTNFEKKWVYVIEAAGDEVVDSIEVTYGGNSIVEDQSGKLWVLCTGNEDKNANAGLFCIDPVTRTVEKELVFGTLGETPERLCISSKLDTLYYLNGDIFRMPVSASALPSTPFVESGNKNFYGLGIDPNTGNVYVADAVDFTQQGTVLRYNSSGTLIDEFRVGINPSGFYFD